MSFDRTELQDSARKLFEAGALAPDRDKSWDGIVEMGWAALAVPEDLGGLGGGRGGLATLYRELGRVLATVPFLPTMIAAEAIFASDLLRDREAWVERLIGGEILTCSLLDITIEVRDGAVSGTLSAVPDADKASHVLIIARDRSLVSLVPIGEVSSTEPKMWDESRQLFDLTFQGVQLQPDLVLARGDAAAKLADALQVHLELGLAADCIGAADAVLDMTVEYLKTRRQFGRPLALFQALKHRCSDLKMMVEGASALFEHCVAGRTGLPFDAVTEAGSVKSFAATMFHAVAEEAIQLHGGIGLTSEHPCHLFQKRSFLNAALGGTIDHWEEAAGRQSLERIRRA